MINFNYPPGLYDVATTVTIETVPYYGDDKGWFRVNASKVKGDSTYLRLVEQRGGLVSHDGVIDWDSTFFFLRQDVHDRISEISNVIYKENKSRSVMHVVEKYKIKHF